MKAPFVNFSAMHNFALAKYEWAHIHTMHVQCQKLRKLFTVTWKLLLRFTVISDVYRIFIPNKTTFTKYCITQWISKLPRSFEIKWLLLMQHLANFTGVEGIVNATVYKTEPIFTGLRHGTLSYFLTLHVPVTLTQSSCDTWQMLKWYSISKQYFCNPKKLRGFSLVGEVDGEGCQTESQY